ncbi:hypothetical protein C8J55DRAFT_146576 [Lentinula edodes]|uniref:Uncharacterized protein n=1 Tax=Lentinula lateritia TaxID=40482 RepID=A0A9W9DIP8_9AGAR|nr:hypothetical protein C8J55DRAFT_146576 [Lentinula edodes]
MTLRIMTSVRSNSTLVWSRLIYSNPEVEAVSGNGNSISMLMPKKLHPSSDYFDRLLLSDGTAISHFSSPPTFEGTLMLQNTGFLSTNPGLPSIGYDAVLRFNCFALWGEFQAGSR